MDLSDLDKILENQPAYRFQQIKKALFHDLADDFDKITTIPLDLRAELKSKCDLEINAKVFESKDKTTTRALITLKDGLKIETVLMKHKSRNTICVSSQIGCPLACEFCATGKLGFKRNLDYYEIIEQAVFFARYLKKENCRINNIVFMGMGEPMLNYENVLKTIRILNDPNAFGIGARHISISTAGIPEGIKKLAEENLQVNLAISLHAPDDKIRQKIMPIAEKYSIKEILDAVDFYVKKTNRRVMFEYILIDGFNDSDECAKKLAGLMNRHLFFVNLILYNPTGIFKPSNKNQVKRFKEILVASHIPVTERYRFGQDIDAACGQLASKSEKNNIKFE